nr:ATP-binding protein [Candidatus Sigynarchaeota archaeon]
MQPLFTTKSKGIGLGLTIVKDIVESYKGAIQVDSKVGIGTTFKIQIPIKENS